MRLYNVIKNHYNLTKSELESFMQVHNVTVNGMIVPYSTIIQDTDTILVDGVLLPRISFYYYMYYKPRGILSTISERGESYIHHIHTPVRVTPAGRLDKDSEGLLLLSNDGAFLNEITGDSSTMDKEYLITVKEEICEEFLTGMSQSYEMDGKWTTPAIVQKISSHQATVILYEGLYHQVRRLVKLNHYTLTELKRIRIGEYQLSDMKPGDLIEFKK